MCTLCKGGKNEEKICTLILLLSLVFSQTITTFATGDSRRMSNISLGKYYYGSITETNEKDSYTFTLNASGRVTLSASARMEWVYYHIYDSEGNELWDINPSWNSTTGTITTKESIDLTKGTYRFTVEKDGRNTGNYSFELDFVSSSESFTETRFGSNNDMYSANSVKVNTNYKGQIANNDEKDFYRFTLNASGRVTLSASAKMEWIYYYIYDSEGNELWKINPRWNSTTGTITTKENIDLTKGTYFYVVEKDGRNTGNYSFKLGYKSANETFKETDAGENNSIQTANNISLNTSYQGQLAVNDEKDFYKLRLSSSGKIYFNVTANMTWIYSRIYDSNGNELYRYNPRWNNVTEKISMSETLDMSAGTYYVVFEKDGSNTGVYSFNIANHKHKYRNVITKATVRKNGKIVKRCSCGRVKSTTTVYYPKSIKLSTTVYSYDGKVKKPSVRVKGSNGKVIGSSNYTVSYSKGRKNIGTYKVTIKFKGNYKGTVTKRFTINPKGTKITSLSAKSKGFKISWKKPTNQISGYEIQYSTSRSFSNKHTKTVANKRISTATYRGLQSKQTYYVRIRTYQKISGNKYYSAWSSVKAVTTKR